MSFAVKEILQVLALSFPLGARPARTLPQGVDGSPDLWNITRNKQRKESEGSNVRFLCAIAVFGSLLLSVGAQPAVNITQHHNHLSRDGLYIEPAFTPSAVTNLQRDLSFDGTIAGHVYAQPLYLDDGPGGRPAVFVVTESNNVYALDAADAARVNAARRWLDQSG